MLTSKTRKTSKTQTPTKKTKKTKTSIIHPDIKIFNEGDSIYVAKFLDKINYLEFIKKIKKGKKCSFDSITWYSDLNVVKNLYKTKDNFLYKFNFKIKSNFLIINKENELFFKHIFTKTKIKMTPLIDISNIKIEIKYNHPYIKMTKNEQAYFEFCFVFGYISIKEQYEFLKFIEFIIDSKIMNIYRRHNDSILNKLKLKIMYYKLMIFNNKNTKYNRLSFYMFDKFACINLCKLLNNKTNNISGVIYPNVKSFWFINMNLLEYILFDQYKNVEYDKELKN